MSLNALKFDLLFNKLYRVFNVLHFVSTMRNVAIKIHIDTVS